VNRSRGIKYVKHETCMEISFFFLPDNVKLSGDLGLGVRIKLK